jgi:hypothetical protein
MSAALVTGGRTARYSVEQHLAFAYHDSGMLTALMEGALDAPDRIPAGAAHAGDQGPSRQNAVTSTTPRESPPCES